MRTLKGDIRELLVVVLSILIAFSLEGWREQRSEAARLDQDLDALREDFSFNRQAVQSSIQRVRANRDGVEALRAEFREPPVEMSRDSVMALMGMAFGVHRHGASTKAYDELLATGGIGRLESPLLRGALGEWATELANVRRVESDNFNNRDWIAMSYITEEVAWAEAAQRIGNIGEHVGPSRFANDLDDLAANRGLDNLLAMRVVMMSDALNRYSALEERVVAVLEALDR